MAKKSKFEMVKNFYDNGLWKEKRVRDAVVKGWISPENFKFGEILQPFKNG